MKHTKWGLLLSLNLTFLCSLTAQARVETVLGSVPLNQNMNLANFMPETAGSEIIISREQYVISYNRQRRSPNWVAWKLESKDVGSVPRSKMFLKDTGLENYLTHTGGDSTVDTTEYNNSCFDRGHQIPSKDRTDTDLDNQETFLTDNMIPQTKFLNRVIWEHLEQHTRDLVEKQGKKAYVVAGPIYDEDFGAIGPRHDIPVPSKNFKIIMILDANADPSSINANTPAIAVIMPNVLQDGSKPIGSAACSAVNMTASPSNDDWVKYQTTIAEALKASGIHLIKH